MKKFICCSLLLIQVIITFCQTSKTSGQLTRDEYLRKSKSQRIGGFVLLGAGTLALVSVSGGHTDLSTVGIVAVAGGISVLTSIPLFIAAARNKRKAKSAAISFKMETNPVIHFAAINTHYYPAFSMRIRW